MVCVKPKIPILGKFFEGLTTENLGIFYGLLVYFTAIGNILCPFGIFCSHLVYFAPVLVFCTKKNLATLLNVHQDSVWNSRTRDFMYRKT
jgi:hypothetical protein